jgi:hypothetical protein
MLAGSKTNMASSWNRNLGLVKAAAQPVVGQFEISSHDDERFAKQPNRV